MGAAGAATWVPAAIAGAGGLASALGGGKSGGGGEIPEFYKRTAGPLATDLRIGMQADPALLGSLNFDPSGNLLNVLRPGSAPGGDNRSSLYPKRPAGFGAVPFSMNEKAILEAQNFFSNLYSNPDIQGSLDVFRRRLNPAADGSLISDPFYNLVRERGTAQALEAGRRVGGLRTSGTSRGVANFLTDAEAQQAQFETGLASEAGNALFNLSMLRGQAGFIPTQTYGSVLSSLGGGTSYAPSPQFSNTAGQAGALLGAAGGNYQKGSKPNTSTSLPFNSTFKVK